MILCAATPLLRLAGLLAAFIVPLPALAVQPATQPTTQSTARERQARGAAEAERIAQARAPQEGAFGDEAMITPEDLSRRVDIVLLLDCSGSMRFALDAARSQFWRIASSVATAEPRPKLRIGLMAYGMKADEFPMVPLNDDLIAVYDQLLRLDISRNAGDEWVGEAIASASGRFWTPEATAAAKALWESEQPLAAEEAPPLRIYFVFGNETVYQGPSNAVDIAKLLPPLGHVNTVHCINPRHESPGDADGWLKVAEAGQGVAMRLDTGGDPMLVITPYDRDLARLNRRLTASYVPIGVLGDWMTQRQQNVDKAAANLPRSVEADLAVALAAWNDGLEGWDLVARVMRILSESDPATYEAIVLGQDHLVDLSIVEEAVRFVEPDQLPKAFARMTIPERAAAVAKAATEREKLRREIAELAIKRRFWLLRKAAEDLKKHWRWQLVPDLEEAVRAPLRKLGYEFRDEE